MKCRTPIFRRSLVSLIYALSLNGVIAWAFADFFTLPVDSSIGEINHGEGYVGFALLIASAGLPGAAFEVFTVIRHRSFLLPLPALILDLLPLPLAFAMVELAFKVRHLQPAEF
jgi:hypothetical protein